MRTVVYVVYPLASDEAMIQYEDIHVFTSDRAAENWIYNQVKIRPGINWEVRPLALDDPVRDVALKPRRIPSAKAASRNP